MHILGVSPFRATKQQLNGAKMKMYLSVSVVVYSIHYRGGIYTDQCIFILNVVLSLEKWFTAANIVVLNKRSC